MRCSHLFTFMIVLKPHRLSLFSVFIPQNTKYKRSARSMVIGGNRTRLHCSKWPGIEPQYEKFKSQYLQQYSLKILITIPQTIQSSQIHTLWYLRDLLVQKWKFLHKVYTIQLYKIERI